MKLYYEVLFRQMDLWVHSRYFSTERAAKRWTNWLKIQDYVKEVSIYRGGAGGEKVYNFVKL